MNDVLWQEQEISSALKDLTISSNFDNNNLEAPHITNVVIDSRKSNKNSLFIAISGKNDANQFLADAIENGCKIAIINDREIYFQYHKSCKLIFVSNTTTALQNLAKFARNRHSGKFIAITGSVGKTTTKEVIAKVLASFGKVFASEGNLNNHIGMPLNLVNMPSSADFGLYEIGMNHFHEIDELAKIIKPNIIAITNIGTAHIENFPNQEGIAKAKAEILNGLLANFHYYKNQQNNDLSLKNNNLLPYRIILNGDSNCFDYLYSQAEELQQYFSNLNVDCKIINIKNNIEEDAVGELPQKKIKDKINYQNSLYSLFEPFSQPSLASKKANFCYDISSEEGSKILVKLENYQYYLNCSHLAIIQASVFAMAVVSALDFDFNKMTTEEASKNLISSLATLDLQQGRGKLSCFSYKNSKIYLVDDSYNASLSSMQAGFNYISQLAERLEIANITLALGEMKEVGSYSEGLHYQALESAIAINPKKIITVGQSFAKLQSSAILSNNSLSYRHFANSDEAGRDLFYDISRQIDEISSQDPHLQPNFLIYLKGSRAVKMEEILNIFTEPPQQNLFF
jgi:UDP-N-acetylmuramoyl-tripeptide--D-alanyl-D-alanine ligase